LLFIALILSPVTLNAFAVDPKILIKDVIIDQATNPFEIKLTNNTYVFQVDSDGLIITGKIQNYNQLPSSTPSRVLVTDSSGYISISSITTTLLDFLSGASSNIQDQLNTKGVGTLTEVNTIDGGSARLSVSNSTSEVILKNFADSTTVSWTNGTDSLTPGIVAGSIDDTELGTSIDTTQLGSGGVTSTEFGYIGTLLSDAQTQLDSMYEFISSAPATDAKLIQTNGTDGKLTLKTLTAGTGITLTNNTSDIVITSTVTDTDTGFTNLASTNIVNATLIAYNATNPITKAVMKTISCNSGCTITNGTDNIQITVVGGSGITSINADSTSAQTIVGVAGNTTASTSAGETIINLGSNVVTTGGSAQVITKELTINSGVLGGQLNIAGNTFLNTGTLTLPTSTDTLVGKSTTDTFTNKIVASNATGNRIIADPSIAILTAGGATLQSASSPVKTTIDGTNMDYITLDFDASSSETAIWNFEIPDDADTNYNVTAIVKFQVASGTAGVCFDGSFLGRTTGETVDSSFGTVIVGCDSSTGTNTVETATMSFGSGHHLLSAGDIVFFKLARDVADATDTNTNDARVIDVQLRWS